MVWQLPLIEQPSDALIGATPEAMLRALGQSSALLVPGADRSRTRVCVVLLHGDEPSGLVAMHRWLRDGLEPTTDLLFIVGAVEAALEHPGLAHRTVPGGPDLNRVFGPGAPPHAFAEQVLALIGQLSCELLVDLHNTSGRTRAYGISTRMDPVRRGLASLFAGYIFFTKIRIGTLLEAVEKRFPCITVECGRAGADSANDTAYRGITRFAALNRPDDLIEPGGDVTVLEDPIRVLVADDIRLEFGCERRNDTDITLESDIDRFNLVTLEAGHRLGWLGTTGRWPFVAIDHTGADVSREYFADYHGEFIVTRPVVPIMMTTDPAAAANDCLCYMVPQ